MAQLTFLPKIDRKATQVCLEEILENVRIYRQFGMIRNEMKVTASSEVRYHGPTNIVGKPAEDIALANVAMSEREVKLQRLSFQIDKALSRFSKSQRDIIVKRYLEDEEVFDFYNYPFFMRCVTQKGEYYEVMNIKGFSDRDSYTKYQIWVSH
ncbi:MULTISPECIES: ArpU family transcriptional regulator [Bacillus]|uniref:ArpU family transcriptional regulator n=1 Tax=Bacillus TaxID=1386 RepID=UPI0020160443|nr:ArpU family transcriptional regulator [Bacillus cereus]